MSIFNKYKKYLPLKFNRDTITCISLIELIYNEQRNLSLINSFKRLGINSATDKITNRWQYFMTKEKVINELNSYWLSINLTNLEEYDLLVFQTDNQKTLTHFGLYIAENRFIHIEQNKYTCISDLDQNWRNTLLGSWRYVVQ